eukprot:m.57259 g.57259  ORF g.57259 m.57259 type:complete len:168 (+) comp15602_c0_seq1:85-588(+)
MANQQAYETTWGFYTDTVDGASVSVSKRRRTCHDNPNGLRDGGPQISVLCSPDPKPEELQFIAQMGVQRVFTWLTGDSAHEHAKKDHLQAIQARIQGAGLQLESVGHLGLGKNASIILGKDDRDKHIAEFAEFIATLGTFSIESTLVSESPTRFNMRRAPHSCFQEQ